MAVSRGTNAWGFHTVISEVLEMDNNDSVEHAPTIFRVDLPLKPTVDSVPYTNVSVPS